MSQLEELIALLDLHDTDYWYDYASCRAREIIDRNPTGILSEVLDCWTQWPENRTEHLAYLLGDNTYDIEKKLINALQHSPYESVVYRANEAASAIRESRPIP